MTDAERPPSAELFEVTRSQADAGMPSAAWKKPVERWQAAIERYVDYRQLPTWRSKALENDGKTESSGSDTAEKAAKLKKRFFEPLISLLPVGVFWHQIVTFELKTLRVLMMSS